MKKLLKKLTTRPVNRRQNNPLSSLSPSLQALTTAALVLPGLMLPGAQAAEDDSVDFQYSHYQEGQRNIYGYGLNGIQKMPNNLNPIEVDSIRGGSRVTLTDRIKFAFNYIQDTWSGATPIGTAPVVNGANSPRYPLDSSYHPIAITGASPMAYINNTRQFFVDKKGNIYGAEYDQNYQPIPGQKNNRFTHVLSFASPETRKQGDFKLSYEWDEAALDVGGGISVEHDYESRFANLGGRFDFNQKQTTFNWGASYTNSDTFATLDPDSLSYFNTDNYDNTKIGYEIDNNGNFVFKEVPTSPKVLSGYVKNIYAKDEYGYLQRTGAVLHGNREDWGTQLGLTQVLGRNSLASLDFGFTRSTGYLANPYKVVYGYEVAFQPNQQLGQILGYYSQNLGYLEIRPDERNQFNWHLGFDQFIEPFDAALHFDYHFAHDDWGINAHTFEADWVQPLVAGWTVTPRIRYYSQSAADFYTKSIFKTYQIDSSGQYIQKTDFPQFYSSDQRLSGFGTLSGGVTVEKRFSKGVSLETGFEYYTHQGGLKLGGGGEQAFTDFDYWVANAALKLNLDALSTHGGHDGHGNRHSHANSPAGVMFDHALPKAGDFMVGYRYTRSEQAGDMLHGDRVVGLDAVNANGCDGRECAVTPNFMAMNMHMLDLMYAPTDSLTLMLMPQWMDMDMTMTPNENVQITGDHGGHGAVHEHQTGGIGDLGYYALYKLFDHTHHHLTLTLGGTAPTGDVDIVLRKTETNPVYDQRIHYGMQLGSGTWDFKPALTYAGELDQFLWGAQVTGTVRMENRNQSGFAFGDLIQGSVWGGYHWTNWLATTVRGVYTGQDAIRGAYPPIRKLDQYTGPEGEPYEPQHIGPFDFPANYGGRFVDLGLGVNVTIPEGAFAGNTLKFEWLQPVHTDYNGYQLDRDGALSATWSVGF